MGFVKSLRSELDHPAVDRFLTAVDQVMNSNTLLLKVRTDSPITDGRACPTLDNFLRSAVFRSAMLEADHDRGWDNLQPAADSTAADEPWILREGFELTCSAMDASAFEARLTWMLCTANSPYRHHRTASQASELIHKFQRQVFQPSTADWSFVAAQPDFLTSTGYYSVHPEDTGSYPAYFDGGPNDSASFIFRGNIFYFLLTNGSP